MTGRATGAGSLPLVLATAMTSWFALWSWGGFVETNSIYLLPLLFGIPFVSMVGFLARWARFPVIVVVAAEVLAVLLFINLVYGTSPFPTGTSINEAAQAFANSIEAMKQYAAPVPTVVREVGPVLVLGGLFCHLLVDLTAVTLGRVPVAGLPLLIIYTLPVSILDQSVSWLAFVLAVSGFLMMLALQEGGRITRWGRQFGAVGTASGLTVFGANDARRHPVAVGASAITLAVFLPLLIPTLNLNLLGSSGDGGSGDREVRITNPMTDLRRDLRQGKDVPLVQVSTTGDAPTYLRVSVLTTFTGNAWTPGDRNLPDDQTATGKIPRPIGLSKAYETTTRDWAVSITDDLKSLWLPTPMAVTRVLANSEWRYDENILDFHSADNDTTTAGMTYSLTELIPQLNGRQLADSRTPRPNIQSRYTALPSGMPDEVSDIARQVTKNRTSDYEKAQALQDYFRSSLFEYSTAPDAGNGNDALLEFLHDKVGYCEQFASAMAVMARSLGIPARVAVGFHSADETDQPGTFEFSSHDLHAWPELYFEDAGWVNFEPTPSSHIAQVPSYTNDRIDEAKPDGGASESSQAPSPTTKPTKPEPTKAPEEKATDQGEDDGFSIVPFLWGGGGLLLLVALALTPRLVRRNRRTRRWQGADPVQAAWDELRDVTLDVGRKWPNGRSPRATGALLAEYFGPAEGTDSSERPRTGPATNPAAMAATAALVEALEQTRYAATPEPVSEQALRDHVHTCESALRGGVTRRERRRAEWFPPSLLPSRRSRDSRPMAVGVRGSSGPDPLDQMS